MADKRPPKFSKWHLKTYLGYFSQISNTYFLNFLTKLLMLFPISLQFESAPEVKPEVPLKFTLLS